jgi:hypothetical protein
VADADAVSAFKCRHDGTATRTSMQNNRSYPSATLHRRKLRPLGVCDRAFVGLILWTLVHTTEALAGEQLTLPGGAAKPDPEGLRPITPLSAWTLPLAPSYRTLDTNQPKTFSGTDFRPRGASMLDTDPHIPGVEEMTGAPGGSVWQRLTDYRAHDRFRLVTLWEAGGSSLSLQAGRKGDPTLQWTSRLMNRGGAPRGLFDELFSTPSGGVAGRGLHWAPRSGADLAGKPAKTLDSSLGTAAGGNK